MAGNTEFGDGSALVDRLGTLIRTEGLQSLLAGFNDGGSEAAVESWVGDGPNDPVVGGDVLHALGRDHTEAMAADLNTTPEQLGVALARIIPSAVDALTPGGRLPDSATLDALDLPALLRDRGVDITALLA